MLSAYGQTIVKSQGQTLVEAAIHKGIYVIKQSYQLEDTVTHQRFGRYGKEEFGSTASLAIRTMGGIIVDSKILVPWEQDKNFTKYKDTHKPVLSRSMSIEFGDSVKSPVNLRIDSLHSYGPVTYIGSTDTILRGLKTKPYVQSTEGWVVWIANDSIIDKYNGIENPEFIIFKQAIDFAPDSISIKIDVPNTTKEVWGGIFVVPEQTEIGQITFFLGGVIVKDAESKGWVVIPPLPQATSILSEPKDELTPLNESIQGEEKNKKKK